MDELRISPGLSIPSDELEVSFARSGGPGGQSVNTTSSKVELRFDVDASRSLTEEQKDAVRAHLGSRMTKDGVLVLQASEHKSQTHNREAAVGRLRNLLAEALRPRKPRTPTRPSRAARRRRLENKRKRSEQKAMRKAPKLP